MPELRPCPRCRQPAQLFDQPPAGVWAACPTKCWIGPVCADTAQAAEAWNEMADGLSLLHAVTWLSGWAARNRVIVFNERNAWPLGVIAQGIRETPTADALIALARRLGNEED